MRPTLSELFLGCLTIAVSGFGGVLPFARRVVVERRRWLTPAEFTDVIALGMFLPGGNVTNSLVLIGHRFRGWRGSVVAVAGILAFPVALTVVLTILYERFGEIEAIRGALTGLAAAAAGLLGATAAKIATPLFHDRPAITATLIVAGVVLVDVVRTPLVLTLVVLIPLSLALHRGRAA